MIVTKSYKPGIIKNTHNLVSVGISCSYDGAIQENLVWRSERDFLDVWSYQPTKTVSRHPSINTALRVLQIMNYQQ